MEKMEVLSGALCLLLYLSGQASAQERNAISLCDSSEKVVFSCSVGKKLLSICAAPDLLVNAGALEYRFGAFSQKPELEYPEGDVPAQRAFSWYYSSFTKGHSSILAFSVGKYSYFVNYESGVFEGTSGGLVVKSGGKLIRKMSCADEPREDSYFLYEIGMPAHSGIVDFIPEN